MDNGSSEDIRALIERTRSLAESSGKVAERTRKLARQTITNLANCRSQIERARQLGLDGQNSQPHNGSPAPDLPD